MVAKELFGLNSDLMDEFQRELTKLDVDLLQRLRSALNDTPEDSGEASIAKGDEVQIQDPDSSNHSPLYHRIFPTSGTNSSLQNDQHNHQTSEGADDQNMREGSATMEDYSRIYRRANGDYREILRIIEGDGFKEKFKDWATATRQTLRTAGHNVAGEAASEPVAKVVATAGNESSLNDPKEPQYCFCNKGNIGIMIRCDNVDVSLNPSLPC